jgi:hypothetical protein
VKTLKTALVIITFGLFYFGLTGCKNRGTTALTAVIKSADQGIAAFTRWAVAEEAKIADEAIAKCKSQPSRQAYDVCARDHAMQRRAPIDRVKFTISLYGSAVEAAHGAQTQNVAEAARAVVDALATVGIFMGGAK